jgi:hypothetical protein
VAQITVNQIVNELFEQGRDAMAERVTAWQCIGCGRIEGAQPCVGICQDRRTDFVYAFRRLRNQRGWIRAPDLPKHRRSDDASKGPALDLPSELPRHLASRWLQRLQRTVRLIKGSVD